MIHHVHNIMHIEFPVRIPEELHSSFTSGKVSHNVILDGLSSSTSGMVSSDVMFGGDRADSRANSIYGDFSLGSYLWWTIL